MKLMVLFITVCMVFLLMACGIDSFDFTLRGMVLGSEPVIPSGTSGPPAWVQIERLGADGARPPDVDVVAEGPIDEDGRFELVLNSTDVPVLVIARGGASSEYWAATPYDLEGADDQAFYHYEAVLSRVRPDDPDRPFVVSPLTTVVKALADQRFALGMEPSYRASLRATRTLMREHFGFDITATMPAGRSSMTEDVRYTLALKGLSDIARDMAERSGYAVDGMNTWVLTEMLVRDARGPGAVLDGVGPDGEVITFDTCSPPCALSGDTLRADLARHLAEGFLRSSRNTLDISYADAGEWLLNLTRNDQPALFPGPSTASIDDEAPVIQMLESPVADERFDTIAFDGNLAPIHVHGEFTGDLAQGFRSNDCPEIYKHTNTMHANDNPMRLRFAVLDDVVGVPESRVIVEVRPEGALQSFQVPARAVGWVSGGQEFEAVITRDHVPRLADTEGRFDIEVRATDYHNHEAAPTRGCWEHRPMAAPVWVSEARAATGPGTLQAVGMEMEQNNLAPLLNGVGPDEGKAVMEFDLRNGTDDLIYVTLEYAQPETSYAKSWIETNAKLYTSDTPDSTCQTPPVTCPDGLPADAPTDSYLDIEGTIPSLVDGVRVWEVTSGAPVERFPCDDCDANEFMVQPRRGPEEPSQYRVQLVTTALPELAPRHEGDPVEVYMETPIHVIYEPTEITGKLLQSIQVCRLPDLKGGCDIRDVYRRYRALTEASLVVNSMMAAGQSRARPGMSRYVPGGQSNTLGVPVQLGGLWWSSTEAPLPAPEP